MSDLIDRQMAVNEAKKLFDMGDCYCDKYSIVGMLNCLPSMQQWISIGDSLPPIYGWYLCTLKDKRVIRLYWDGKRWIDNVRKHMFELYFIISKTTGEKIRSEQEDVYWDDWVRAWMKLPEPWGELE